MSMKMHISNYAFHLTLLIRYTLNYTGREDRHIMGWLIQALNYVHIRIGAEILAIRMFRIP